MARKKWWARGHGNLHLSLESYTRARDGRYHLLDAYGQKQPTFLIELQARAPMHACCAASSGLAELPCQSQQTKFMFRCWCTHGLGWTIKKWNALCCLAM